MNRRRNSFRALVFIAVSKKPDFTPTLGLVFLPQPLFGLYRGGQVAPFFHIIIQSYLAFFINQNWCVATKSRQGVIFIRHFANHRNLLT